MSWQFLLYYLKTFCLLIKAEGKWLQEASPLHAHLVPCRWASRRKVREYRRYQSCCPFSILTHIYFKFYTENWHFLIERALILSITHPLFSATQKHSWRVLVWDGLVLIWLGFAFLGGGREDCCCAVCFHLEFFCLFVCFVGVCGEGFFTQQPEQNLSIPKTATQCSRHKILSQEEAVNAAIFVSSPWGRQAVQD